MITSDDIVSITQNILTTMLHLESQVVGPCDISKSSDRITGCVQISGEWQGAVVIQASQDFATFLASRLIDIPSADVSEEDIRDGFAELTNMIGGNIKGQVPCPSFLSIPCVTTGQDFEFQLSGANVRDDVFMDCETNMLRIMLCEAKEKSN